MPGTFVKADAGFTDGDDKHRQWADALRAAAAILEAGPRVGLIAAESPESSPRLESALWRIVDVAGEIATDPSVDHHAATQFTGKGFRVEPRDGWEPYAARRTQPGSQPGDREEDAER